MKKLLFLFFTIFAVIPLTGGILADTVNIDWMVDGQTYAQTTCNAGDDLILPSPPTKYGYTFQGWALYTPIEYLESTGTQYIDTRSNFLYGDEFYFEYMPVASYSGENKGYGAGVDLASNITGGGRVSGGGSVCIYALQTNLCYVPSLKYNDTLGKRYNEHWKMTNGYLNAVITDMLNGDTYAVSKDNVGVNYSSGESVYLWRDHRNFLYPSKLRIYRTWLKRANGTMAFDFIPVLDPDGVPCMYDRVTNTYFYNSGAGAFIAGPIGQ